MQLSTLSTKLGLGSELVDWYRDATSVTYGQLLIDLSPRTDDRLRYCPNNETIPSKFFFVWDQMKPSKLSEDEHTKSLRPISHKCKSFFPQVCPKEFISFLCESIVNLLKGNLQSIKNIR